MVTKKEMLDKTLEYDDKIEELERKCLSTITIDLYMWEKTIKKAYKCEFLEKMIRGVLDGN